MCKCTEFIKLNLLQLLGKIANVNLMSDLAYSKVGHKDIGICKAEQPCHKGCIRKYGGWLVISLLW